MSLPEPGEEISSPKQANPTFGHLPIYFEPNRGQTDPHVKFIVRTGGVTTFLTTTGVVFSLPNVDGRLPSEATERTRNELNFEVRAFDPGHLIRSAVRNQTWAMDNRASAIKMRLVGANPNAQIEGLDRLPGISNYFIGNDPAKWRTSIPHYAKVRYHDVYPGIDLAFYARRLRLEYDFIVAPGADPRVIQLAVEGADAVDVDRNGDLIIHTASTLIRQKLPAIFQEIDGVRKDIAGRHHLPKGHRVSFDIGQYDTRHALVIDPVLVYSTLLGGLGQEDARKIAVDSDANVYVAGSAGGPAFPVTPGALKTSYSSGGAVAFVAKINSSGSSLLYCTFLGGSGGDRITGIAADRSGNVYVTGNTLSVDFPVVNALQPAKREGPDAFVAKLGPLGDRLIYSTYLGGNNSDSAIGLRVDTEGNAVVAGQTSSTDFPTLNAVQPFLRGQSDVFISKLTAAGNGFIFSTLLGGSNDSPQGDVPSAMTLDGAGNIYVTGFPSFDFPLANAFQSSVRGRPDLFVCKLRSAGDRLVYSTFLGGTDLDVALGIAADSSGNAYITGYTMSSDFPVVNAIQSTLKGTEQPIPGQDAFVSKLSSTGDRLVYSTYLGGTGRDSGTDIAVDSAANAAVVGSTQSTDFPLVDAIPTERGGSFLARLNSSGNGFVFSTYLGGKVTDRFDSMATDSSGNLYLSQSLGYIETHDSPIGGGPVNVFVITDGAVLKLSTDENLTIFVPVIVSTAGLNGSFFDSELALTNRSEKDVELELIYSAAFGGGSGSATDVLPAGKQRIERDAIAYLRRLGIPIPASGNRGGTLTIRVSGPTSHSLFAATVRTMSVNEKGRAGLAYAGVPHSSTFRGTSYVFGLRQDANDRSNLALQNAGTMADGNTALRVTVYSGEQDDPRSYTLPDEVLAPGDFSQINGIVSQGGPEVKKGYVRIEQISGSAPYYTYGVVNDQESSDGSFIPPVRENQLLVSPGWMLPVVVETASYTTEVVVANALNELKTVALNTTPFSPASALSIALKPGEQRIIPDFVNYLRAQGIAGLETPFAGPLFALPDSGGNKGIFLGARVLRKEASGRYGVFFQASPYAPSTGEIWLYGLQQDSETRSNVAIANPDANPSFPGKFKIDIFDGETGRNVATVDRIEVPGLGWLQLNSLLANYAPSSRQGYVRVVRAVGSNPFLAYAVINDGAAPGQRTGDGAFVAGSP